MKRAGGRGELRREGAILLIRDVEEHPAMSVKCELWEGERMERLRLEVEWNITDKRFVELRLLMYIT